MVEPHLLSPTRLPALHTGEEPPAFRAFDTEATSVLLATMEQVDLPAAEPDVIMVGETRDAETARVMSTLHTNSAPKTVICTPCRGIEQHPAPTRC